MATPLTFIPDKPKTFIPDTDRSGISVGPAGPPNWADVKIEQYHQMEKEKQEAQYKRDVLEERLKRERLIEKMRGTTEPVFGPQRTLEQRAESDIAMRRKIGGIIPPYEQRREAARMGGGLVGGMGPHPILGAGLGGAGMEALYQLGQHAAGSERRPQTSIEAAKRIGKAGGMEMGEEALARGVMRAVSPGTGISPERRATLRYMKQKGIQPTAAQATESVGTIGILEGIAEGSWTGGGHLRAHKGTEKQLLASLRDDIVQRLGGMSDVDAGLMIKELITNKKVARQAAANAMYKEVARVNRGRAITTQPLKDKFSTLLKSISSIDIAQEVGEEPAKSLVPSLENKRIVQLAREVMTLPDQVPFEKIDWARRQIGEIAYARPTEQTGQLLASQEQRILRDVYSTIGEIYKNPKHGLSAEGIKLLEKAHGMTTQLHEIYDKDLIKRIVKEHPEKVVKGIIQKGATTNIDEVLAAAGPEGKAALKGAFVTDLLTDKAIKRSEREGAELSGSKLLDYINRGVGEDVVEKFVGSGQLTELKRFGDALRVYAAKPAALGGGLTIKILQAGAIMEIGHIAMPGAAGRTPYGAGTAATILLGPLALSHIFTNKEMTRYFTNALISEGGPKEVTRILTRLLANKKLRGLMEKDKQNMQQEQRETIESAAEQFRQARTFGGRGF